MVDAQQFSARWSTGSLIKALLLLLPSILVASVALHWPAYTIRFQYPVSVEQNAIGSKGIPTKFSANPVDGQIHLPNGKHYMLDFHDVDPAVLTFLGTSDGNAFLAQEIGRSGMTTLGNQSHLLPGGGLTVVFLLSESHMSIHTWPEHSFAALDIYTCGNSMAADRLVTSMHALLRPGAAKISYIERGSDLSHSVRVESYLEKMQATSPKTTEVPILLDSVRPELLTPSMTADICVNADFDGGDCFLWRNASLLYSQKSEIQLVEVVVRQSGQRCLLLDGAVQFCDLADNDLYTRALAEPVMQPLSARRGDVDIYVIGGGDGWVATHLLAAYASAIQSIRVIDIDPDISEVTQRFFPIVNGTDSFRDSRVQYIAADAALWLRDAPDASADAVIIDCTDYTVRIAQSVMS